MEILTDWLASLPVVLQALVATGFTWSMTALGAAAVFFWRRIHRSMFDIMLGAAAGIMLAASYWSLLAPAVEYSGGAWHPALIGFLLGGMFMVLLDRILPHLHPGLERGQPEGPASTWRRSVLLLLAMTIHNLPEGLAIGVAFGAAATLQDGPLIGSAIALAIGIGLQNFPEGTAVAMPLRGMGMSRWKSFGYGQASALVEPIGAVLGAVAVTVMRPILPYALAFAAAAMIFVVIEELIPESHSEGNGDLATGAALVGFAIMMTLDVALG